MIGAVRFLAVALWSTARHALRATVAAWWRVPDTPGGVYDDATASWSRALLRAGRITVHVDGVEKLRDRPCVYISNHVSMIDIWALAVSFPRVPKFVFKKELMRVPLFGTAARAAGHIVIDRTRRAAAFAAYEEAALQIRAGAAACVFAEGTRSRTGRLLPFKKGPFVLAIAAQVPVVPVVVRGSYDLMPRRALYPRPGEVTLRIGGEIPTAGLGYGDRERLSGEVRAAMLALGAVPEPATPD
jgi:1-acyl-sn-glycerol-3-phosphate acyltransferase